MSNADGPVGGVVLRLLVYRPEPGVQVRGGTTLRSGAHGMFELPVDTPDDHYVLVDSSAHGWCCTPTRSSPETGRVEVQIESNALLEGSVLDSRGEPVPHLRVRVRGARPDAASRRLLRPAVDFRGRWRTWAPDGPYVVSVHAKTGLIAERKAEVVSGGSWAWDLQVEEEAFVQGHLDVPAGAQDVDFDVQLFVGSSTGPDVENGLRASVWTTPADRSFRLLRPGGTAPYWLLILARDCAYPCHVVGPLTGSRASLRIPLPAGAGACGVVSGRVLRPQTSEDHSETWTAVLIGRHGFRNDDPLDEEGRFSLESVPGGTFTLEIQSADDRVQYRRMVALRAGVMSATRTSTETDLGEIDLTQGERGARLPR